jgi:hypothetical protein
MRGRRPTGPEYVWKLQGSQQACRRLEVILRTLGGEQSVQAACAELGIAPTRFHQLRQEALQAALRGLEPGQAGRPATAAQDPRLSQLQAEIHELRLAVQAEGHSYLGSWVNLGAGSQLSNLRNDCAPVSTWLCGQEAPTGLSKLGALVGDYTRMGLGTLVNCGTVVGACCHLLPGGGLLRGEVPSFCSALDGQLRERTALRQLFGGLERVMARRGCPWTQDHAEFLLALFEQTAPARQQRLRQRAGPPGQPGSPGPAKTGVREGRTGRDRS